MFKPIIRRLNPIAQLATLSPISAIRHHRRRYSTMPKGAAAARGRKRAAADEYENDGFVVDDGSTSKKPKTGQSAKGKQVDNEGADYWELSSKRRVTISEFHGKPMVSIREYYEKDGVQAPGKKGIALSLDQYNVLMEVLPEIEASLAKKGQTVVRPNFEGSGSGAANEDAGDAGGDTVKRNHEATSDEDDE
ncbi:rna polymerase ii transcriptional coactivator [Diplodia corticola]|uniref:Rna polymerase ii transcriptional coactivator n=1 Tax=Diplodia corticola TaxID=236234 RepID=A0A1J9R8A6_9PEZI|nr:rna polymerase ii transcriptional coactivator [Diplodia corticola]OJD36816.1 rna polymerase ii transcriptional coactivator [Diplodia corticola]